MHEPHVVPRRRLLRVGGTTIAAAAVLAACQATGDDDPSVDERARPSQSDRDLLRTASSLDELAVSVYQRAIDSGLVTTTGVMDAIEVFRRHHRQHAALFQRATADAGGRPFREPNPAVLESVEPMLAAAADEAAVLAVVLDVERVLAQTYQSFVGGFIDRAFDVATMSVGGTESQHAAVLAPFTGQLAAPVAFQPTSRAIAPGTGLPAARPER